MLGNTQQQREQGFNVARTVGLMAGLPVEAGGATVNRLCGSSLQALAQASHAIVAGAEDVQIVGGLEHMHHIPMDAGIDLNPKLFTRTSKGALMMGITAEFLAQTQGISPRGAGPVRPRAAIKRRAAATDERRVRRRDRSHLGPRRSGQPHRSSTAISASAPTPAWKRSPRCSRRSCPAWAPSRPATARRSTTAPPRCW